MEDLNENEVIIVEIEDPNGEVLYYEQDMIIPVGEEEFAILVRADGDNAEDDEVTVAKIELLDDGEVAYVAPTEVEFELVEKAYEALFED